MVFADFHGGENIFHNDVTPLNVGMLTFSRLISHAYILLSLALVEVHS
jgi:hypothetical protein